MTTDELLTLAAKAANKQITFSNTEGVGPFITGTMIRWNPLYDDGDALRLMIQLKLIVNTRSWCIEVDIPPPTNKKIPQPICGDIFESTRYAIVRAAAMIADDLPQWSTYD